MDGEHTLNKLNYSFHRTSVCRRHCSLAKAISTAFIHIYPQIYPKVPMFQPPPSVKTFLQFEVLCEGVKQYKVTVSYDMFVSSVYMN